MTVTLSDTSQNARLGSLTQLYSLVAIRPANEKTLSQACINLDCDIISLDLSVRLPFHFRFPTLSAAIARGIRFEICYGPGITGSGVDARRNLIGNATSLIRATRGRGIIISSEAQRALGLRAPWDVVNLACVWGLSRERGKEAVCEEARKVVALAGMKRSSYRGVIDVVHGGDKEAFEQNKQQKGQKGKQKGANGNAAATVAALTNSKRKATNELDSGADAEPQLSKREMKRRAKKARLEASETFTGTTNSPKP